MLRSLKVINYAIIDNLQIDFERSFNIITGETGAGKSILMGALGLIMGNRADTKILFDLNKKGVAEAEFSIEEYNLFPFFRENELDYHDNLIIRREILPGGKSRAFVNDSPANLKVLRSLCNKLVDLHRQFDTLGLNDEEVQLQLLDAYAGNLELLKTYQENFEHYQSLKNRLDRLIRQKKKDELEQELLRYQLEEFENVALEKGQLKQLEEEQNLLENAESIKNTLKMASYHIEESEQSIIGALEEVNFELQKINQVDEELTEITNKYFDLIEELKSIAQDFENKSDRTALDPERLEEVNIRIDQIYSLQAKHQIQTEEEYFEKWELIANKIANFKESNQFILDTKNEIDKLNIKLESQSRELRKNRKSNALELCKKVERNLKMLSMKDAQFEIQFEALDDFNSFGKDLVKYVFTANKGARLQEIREVASGGELSRLSLCIKSELAKFTSLPTLIFDEIDSGVSGEISHQMGKMLKALSGSHQIITITHSPQIASKADRHFRIFKINDENRSFTRLETLGQDGRIVELAKMLSGEPPSEAAIANAKSLMKEA